MYIHKESERERQTDRQRLARPVCVDILNVYICRDRERVSE
jgi:hypothetical protein